MKQKHKIEDFKKFLIVQTAFIGDVAISLELVEALHSFNSIATIDFVTTPVASELVKLNEFVNKVFAFDKRNKHKKLAATKKFAQEISQNNYDCIISLHQSFRTTYLVSNIQAKLKIGFKHSSFGFVAYDILIEKIRYLNEHYRVLLPLQVFGISYENYKIGNFHITFNQNIGKEIESFAHNNVQNGYIVVAPGSKWETKKWGKEQYAKLIELLLTTGEKCVLIGSTEDMDDCNFIARKTGVPSLAGHTNLTELLYIIKNSKLLISNDSAPVHFANLVGTPVVDIFGPTSPIFGFAPIGADDLIIEKDNLECRPCQIHGGKKCPINTHICMKSIAPEFVFENIKNKYLV